MNERFVQYRDKVTQFWGQFGKKQKILFISVIGILIIVIILLSIQFSKVQYETAFKDLNQVDAAAVMQQLDASGISYKLSADGKSISVPSALAAKAQVDIGSQGIVQNGSLGFGAFTDSSSTFGSTDREFDVKYKSALNGEIQQLLNRMQGVSDSKVVVNLPRESVFAGMEAQEAASASVSLKFKPGYRPSQEAVDSYFNLVKTAVPNLAIDNITITSDEGELMSSVNGGNGTMSSAVEEQMKLRKKFENDVKASIQQFLGRWYSSDKIEVLVAASMNFDQKTSEEKLVSPVNKDENKGIEISVQESQKSYSGKDGQAGGVAGTGSTEIPGYPANGSNGTSTSEESSKTTNYDVNRVTSQIQSSPFSVKDLSVNVAVEPSNGDIAAFNASKKQEIETILVNFVSAKLADSGIKYSDAELAKKVSVVAQNFGENSSAVKNTTLSNSLWIGGGIVALALLAGIGFMIFRRRRNKEEVYDDEPLQPALEFPSIDLENVTNENQVRKQLETLAKKKPDEFVNLLRSWLADESR
ncbi:flagellar M-ring protein FliF [Paenibacillus selenitireducens]|uniref:Flagellar M-ring protein n=1 Tax=Paenibacillus selenitireducens TaxID=1324314 RepID=A0A1T2XCU0_9BACL|nr:flagellar basal-body MS-ring/collar protein FliF [Paenibacillus selenitireducens]OPA77592.1 flagellar M-ring protein FliF [Paenibacillus selenitireducens]